MDTDGRTISKEQFERVARCWKMARYHASSLDSTRQLLGDLLPGYLRTALWGAIDRQDSLRDFLRRYGVKVKRQKPRITKNAVKTKGTKKS